MKGPATPLVSRVRNFYIRDLVILAAKQKQELETVRYYLGEMNNKLKIHEDFRSIIVQFNVDPAWFLILSLFIKISENE